MSDTPRTDTADYEGPGYRMFSTNGIVDLCRTLERELTAANQRIAELEQVSAPERPDNTIPPETLKALEALPRFNINMAGNLFPCEYGALIRRADVTATLQAEQGQGPAAAMSANPSLEELKDLIEKWHTVPRSVIYRAICSAIQQAKKTSKDPLE